MIKRKFIIPLCSVIAFSASAQDKTDFSLEEALEYALEHNIEVQNSMLDLEIAHKQSLEATSMGLPQISIQGQFSNFLNLPVQVVGANFINPNAPEGETIAFKAGTDYNASGTFQVNQLLFNGSYIVGLQVAKFFVNFSETAVLSSKVEALYNVTQAYQIASVGKENLIFVDSMVILTNKLVEDQREFVNMGLLAEENLDQLEYSLLSAKSAQTSARIQYNNALNLLKLTMGYPMNADLNLLNNATDLLNQEISSPTQGDITQNMNYQLLEKQKVLSEYNLKNYRYGQLPTLGAFFQQTYNAYRNEFNFFADERWFPQTLWGIQLNIPIFSGGQKYAQIAQAKIRVMKDENTLKQLEQSLLMQELQFKSELIGAKQNLELQQRNVELAGKIYSNAITRKEIGNGNALEVTQKYNQLMIAQQQYFGSMIDVFKAQLNLDKLYNKLN